MVPDPVHCPDRGRRYYRPSYQAIVKFFLRRAVRGWFVPRAGLAFMEKTV